MKFLKLAVAAVLAFAGSSAYAFHDGGVAACEGCHVMHNAGPTGQALTTREAGSAAGLRTNATNSYLLQGSDQSSTCLICHSGTGTYHIATALTGTGVPGNYTPGGDFGWLTAITAGFDANRKGHNVVAADYGMVVDSQISAPGGSFYSGAGKAAFACSNCHDPHGRYRLQDSATNPTVVGPVNGAMPASSMPIVGSGSYGPTAPNGLGIVQGGPGVQGQALGVYRLLGGVGYSPASNPAFPFASNPPSAVAPTTYNQIEDNTHGETRVAYGYGMSEWCQNCHTNIHLDGYVTGAPNLRHPAGNGAKLQPAQVTVYNAYVGSGNMTGVTSRYNSLVPFEVGTVNLAALAAGAASGAIPGSDPASGIFTASGATNVMCISCHRAHGSGFASITRWDNSPGAGASAFISSASALVAVPGLTAAQTTAAYYGRGVGNAGTDIRPFQRSLCNKCHGKD